MTARAANIKKINKTDKDIAGFLKDVRDLLGFIRVENAVLMDNGSMSLSGLYMHKMMMMKDLEETATDLISKEDNDLLNEGVALLVQVQKELNENAAQHLRALSQKKIQKTATKSALLTSKESEGGVSCH